MTSKTQPVPRTFMYLDVEGIESLYAQTVDRIELEFTQTRKNERRGEVGVKAAFGSMLTGLLGLKEVGGATKLGASRGQIEEAKSHLTVERKMSNLIDYLARHKGSDYFESLQEAGEFAASQRRSVYFVGEHAFDAPDFYPGRRGVAEVNEAEAVLFLIEPTYDASEAYFKKIPLRFAMSAGLPKFTRVRGKMGATSHEAILFRETMGKNINLAVFGQVSTISGNSIQIKPFAIWRP